VNLYPHQTAQAQHHLSSLSTVNTPPLACRQQCHRRPYSAAPKLHAERCSPQTAGDLTISNHNILNTFKLHTRWIWLFTAHPAELNPVSHMNPTLTKIQSKTCTLFPTSNPLNRFSVSNGSIFGTGRFYRSAWQRPYHIKNRRFFKRTAQLSPPILIREFRAW